MIMMTTTAMMTMMMTMMMMFIIVIIIINASETQLCVSGTDMTRHFARCLSETGVADQSPNTDSITKASGRLATSMLIFSSHWYDSEVESTPDLIAFVAHIFGTGKSM